MIRNKTKERVCVSLSLGDAWLSRVEEIFFFLMQDFSESLICSWALRLSMRQKVHITFSGTSKLIHLSIELTAFSRNQRFPAMLGNPHEPSGRQTRGLA